MWLSFARRPRVFLEAGRPGSKRPRRLAIERNVLEHENRPKVGSVGVNSIELLCAGVAQYNTNGQMSGDPISSTYGTQRTVLSTLSYVLHSAEYRSLRGLSAKKARRTETDLLSLGHLDHRGYPWARSRILKLFAALLLCG